MTPIELTDNGLLDNLPLLTQVADEDAPDDLPTLTEVVTDETTSHSTRLSKDDSQVAGYEGQAEPDAKRETPTPEAAVPCAPNGHGKGTVLENETSHARFPHPNPLPQAGEGANESLREFHVNEKEVQRLLRRLETHLENRFANKLSVNLEQLQRQAIDQAVSELKAELPKLLREMLNTPLHP